MRLAKLALLQFSVCLGLTACAGPKANLPENPTDFAAPSYADVVKQQSSDYEFGPFDRVKVSVYRVPELSGEYRVEPSGIIAFPLIGTVKVSGMTTSELSQILTRTYGAQYLENPDVTVQLVEATGRELTVEGSVRNPGVFSTFGESNLVQAIARAGGPTDYANSKRVLVFRKIDGEQKVALFNLAEIRAGLAENPTIYGGDIVVVDGNGLKAAYQNLLTSIPLFATFLTLIR